MLHSYSKTLNGLFGNLNWYAFMLMTLTLSSNVSAQTCPIPTSNTGSLTLNSNCNEPTAGIIQSGDALEIILQDCSTYNFKVCYNESYSSPEKEQVQIQLSNSTGFVSEASSAPKGCAEITYTAGVSDIATIQAFSHSCLGDWKEWDITITKLCCTIDPGNTVSITASETDCTAPAFAVNLPLISLGCNSTTVNYSIFPALVNPPSPPMTVNLVDGQLDIPAGNEIGNYTIIWSVFDCLSNTISSTTQIISITPLVVCNDQVNLTIPNGILTVLPSMVAQEIGAQCLDDYEVSISNAGIPIGNEISCNFSGQTLEFTLTHKSTGLACTGTLLIEDKTGPNIFCEDMDIACSVNSSASELGAPLAIDNCDPNPTLTSFDNNIDYECTNGNFLNTIERTWTATDNQGNTRTCVQTINIIRPTLAGLVFPSDIAIDCKNANTDPSNTGGPSISAMISGNQCNFIILYEDIETIACSGTTKIIRRWTVKDWCTGSEMTDSQIIEIKDSTGPTIVCPAVLSFGANENDCNATVTFPTVVASDDCSEITNVTISWEFGTGEGPYTNVPIGDYNVTYTAEDDCGNTSQCVSQVSITDNVIPVAVCDLNTSVGIGQSQTSMICAEDVDSGSYDNCELVSREIRLVGSDDYTDCIPLTCAQVGQTLMVQMQVTDVHGLVNNCTVAVNVFDKIPPTITNCASDIEISCDANTEDTTLTGSPTVIDNCSSSISYTDVRNVNECNIGEIIRTFTASDNSNNTSTCVQRITLVDNTAPVISFLDNITIICQDKNDEIGKPSVQDNCGKFGFTFSDEEIENSDCIQRFNRTWEVLNFCTDEKVSQVVAVTLLNDTTLPQFSGAPTEITINCSEAIPDFTPPIISDVCDNDLFIETLTTDQAGTCPDIRVLTKIYTATDACGNSNSFTQTIRLVDNQGPTFIDFPADQTINCETVINNDLPTVTDNCDENPVLTFVQDTIAGPCANEIIVFRTYTITDQCSNTTNAVQVFSFIDDIPPLIQGQTNDITLSCQFQIPAFDLGAIDNCDESLSITVEDTSIPGSCPNNETVTRVYTVTDDCGNATLDTILITLVDSRAPQVTASNLVENLTISCNQPFPTIDFTIIDDCDNDVDIEETRDTIGTACNYNVTRTFTATDDCGNATTLSQNLTISDNEAPFFSTFPQDQDVTIFSGESAQVDVIDAVILDNCSTDNEVNFVIDYFSDGDQATEPNVEVDGVNASGVYPLGSHTISFQTTDDCGNSLTQDLLISVVDFSPSGLCTSVTLEIGENGLLSVQASVVLEDPNLIDDEDISSIIFVDPSNFTQEIGPNLILDCDDIGVVQFAIEITSTDGTRSVCSNMINLIDPDQRCGSKPTEATVAGKVFSVNGKAMQNVEMHLTNTSSKNILTDQFGIYSFDKLPVGSACQVSPKNDNNPALGITSYDMVLIMQHILQISSFTNPYQYIAADVDMNGKIDLFDLVEIRSLILYQINAFKVSPSYRFVEASYQFENPNNPLAENISESHICPALDKTMIDLDFISIKMGDIDGALAQAFTSDLSSRSSTPMQLTFEDRQLTAGEETIVEIYTNNIEKISALQFSIIASKASILDIEADKTMQGNYHLSNYETLHFVWTKYDMPLARKMVQIKVKANQDCLLSEVLQLDDTKPSIQFSSEGYEQDITLEATNKDFEASVNVLMQNKPNPFVHNTTIPFYLYKAGEAEIQIFDFAGRQVYENRQNYTKGWQQHEFTHTDLAPGIYIYTLLQGHEKLSKKMVITK